MMTKYGAKPVVIDNVRFHSTAEGRRYEELKILLSQGEITNLELQPKYVLEVNGLKVGTYIGDSRYRLRDGTLVVEDVKGGRGTITAVYRLKKKILKALYDIDIKEHIT